MKMKDVTQIIAEVDLELELEEVFVSQPSTYVCQVKKDGKSYVLRLRDTNSSSRREVRNLAIIATMEGTSNMIHCYDPYGDYNVTYLTTFSPGQTLYDSGMELSKNLFSRLSAIVRRLHQRGLCGLDLNRSNIVVSPDGERITFVDLGSCLLESELSPEDIQRVREEDLRKLENIGYLRKV